VTYLLDTNTLIYFFKGLGRVAERLFAVLPSQVAVSAVSLYELEVGLARSTAPEKRRAQLDELMAVIRLLPFDALAAAESARLRVRLESRGAPIAPMDTLIAGTALAHGAVMVTRNTREFGRIDGLRVEDWHGD